MQSFFDKEHITSEVIMQALKDTCERVNVKLDKIKTE